MNTIAKGIRITRELERAVAREAEQRGQSWSAAGHELLSEGIKMRRAPGIVFADGPAGRRAVVAGSGLDVWEVVATWQSSGEDWSLLRQSYPWLSEPQLRSALAFYELYPQEIDARLAREREWTHERVRRELPFTRPRGSR